MPNTIILKKSSVAGKVPLSGDLTFGEVALNYADGKIYYKNTTTNIDFVGNGGTFTNSLTILNSTQSTSTTTGALTVAGGTGIGGNLYIDGVVRIQNSSTNTTSDTGALVVTGGAGFGGNIHVQGYGHFGLEPSILLANPLAVFTGNVNSYNQIAIQNLSNGLLASADIVATANDGDDTSGYIDLGINNSNYSSVDWTMSGARDGYLYVSGNNLTVGTDTTGKEVRIHVGGTLAADVVAIFRDPATPSTSDITGSFNVNGGAGITGDVHIGETLHIGANPLTSLANTLILGTSNIDGFTQVSIQNRNAGPNASADYVVTADDGDDTTGYIDLGLNNSGFSNVDWTISGPRDGYLYVAGNSLTLGTDSTGTTVKIHVGGTTASNIVATFNEPTTNSNSTSSGALVIDGGVGIGLDLRVGGSVYSNGVLLQNFNTATLVLASVTAQTATNAAIAYSLANTSTTYVGRSILADSATTAISASTAVTATNWAGGTVSNIAINSTSQTPLTITATGRPGNAINTWTFYSNQSVGGPSSWIQFPDSTIQTTAWTGTVATVTNAAIAFSLANTSTTFVGRAAVADLATTSTSAATAFSTIGVHTAGTGLTGSNFNGSANQTWTLNTATLMAIAVTATSAATAFSLANTSTTFVGRAAVADLATTATSAATAFSLANTSTTFVGRAVTATDLSAGSAGQIIYKNASNITTSSSGLVYDGVSIKVNGNLESTFSSGDEGGEIQLAKPATNTTLAGPVSIDIYQNKLRFFETGGSARGFYIDITSGTTNAGTDLVTGTGTPFNGGTITGALTINNSTAATSTNSGALQIISGGAGIGGNLVADQVWSVNNGNSTNFKVGDDAWIGDYNVSNSIRIKGQQDSTQAYLVFGDSNGSNYIGRSGTNPITVTGPFNTTGVTKITDTTAASSTITGALVVTGGVGIGGALYINTTSFIAGAQILTTATVNSFVTAGVSSITAGTDTAVSTSTGAITVWNTSTLQSVTTRGATTNQAISITNSTAATSTTTGALIVTGGIGISGNAHIGGNIVVKNTAIVGDASTTSVLTTAVTLDSFAAATYRSAQYIISISNNSLGEYQTSDVLVVHNGTNSFVQATSVFTGNKALLNFNTTISSGNVLLQGTGNQTGANANIVKIQKTYITI